MNVLSLFNGCGMLRPALDKAGITVTNYYSSEIDKYACQIAAKNYPDTVQLGDVNNWQTWDLPQTDLLTAGFPCQDLSCAGKQQGLNGERSGLLYEVLKIRDALKPKYFLFENVASMSKHWRDEITRLVGVNPVELNSKYWGAQNRARLFWTNIPGAKNIEMMQVQNDRKIYLKDILIDGAVDCEKSRCLTARYQGVAESDNQLSRYLEGKPGQIVLTETAKGLGNINPSGKGMNGNVFSTFAKSPTLTTNKGEGVKIAIPQNEYNALFISSEKQLQILKSDTLSNESLVSACLTPDRVNKRQNGPRFKQDGKSFTLTAQDRHGVSIVQKAHGFNKGAVFDGGKTPTLTSNSWEHNNHILSEVGIRKLHPIECERLMNLPDGYTEGVSNAQRYKMLGNGWDVDVVAALLRGLVDPVTEIQPDLFAEHV